MQKALHSLTALVCVAKVSLYEQYIVCFSDPVLIEKGARPPKGVVHGVLTRVTLVGTLPQRRALNLMYLTYYLSTLRVRENKELPLRS